MRWRWLIVLLPLLGVLGFAPVPRVKDKGPKDGGLADLQGKWEVESMERSGANPASPPGYKMWLDITKDTWTQVLERDGKESKSTAHPLKLDLTKSPPWIDLVRTGSLQPIHGVFRIDKDTLTITSTAPNSATRPTKVDRELEPGQMRMKLKRVKP